MIPAQFLKAVAPVHSLIHQSDDLILLFNGQAVGKSRQFGYNRRRLLIDSCGLAVDQGQHLLLIQLRGDDQFT